MRKRICVKQLSHVKTFGFKCAYRLSQLSCRDYAIDSHKVDLRSAPMRFHEDALDVLRGQPRLLLECCSENFDCFPLRVDREQDLYLLLHPLQVFVNGAGPIVSEIDGGPRVALSAMFDFHLPLIGDVSPRYSSVDSTVMLLTPTF